MAYIARRLPTQLSDDETESNPAVPGGSLTSKPTWWNTFGGFRHVGFFVFGEATFDNQNVGRPTNLYEQSATIKDGMLSLEIHSAEFSRTFFVLPWSKPCCRSKRIMASGRKLMIGARRWPQHRTLRREGRPSKQTANQKK